MTGRGTGFSGVPAERYRAAHIALTRVLTSEPLESALPRVLEAVGENMNWQLGALWLHDPASARLHRRAMWHAAGLEAVGSDWRCGEQSFPPGAGLPGRAVEGGRSEWISDITAELSVPGSALLQRQGLRAAICVPITIEGRACGAIAFFSREPRPPEDGLIDLLDAMGAQVGQFLQRRKAEERIAHQALHDPLTGLPNRTLFMDRLEVALSRRSSGVAVLYLDLDRFRLVNESLGQAAGDELLRATGERLSGAIRASDTAARIGGDRFAMVCDDVPGRRTAKAIAARALLAVSTVLVLDGREHHPRASIGLALAVEADEVSGDTLLASADAAMHRAKALGGGRYEVYDRASGATASERLATESLLRRGIEQGAIVVHYQPQIDLQTGRVAGVEALARWQHPERGLLGPADFIGIAEESGLIIELGAAVLAQACLQTRAWHDAGAQVHVAVNISPRQFTQPDMPLIVSRAIADAGIPAPALCLEITESTVMTTDEAERVLDRLVALGVATAIDDFGVGFSSLARLKRLLPIDYLKIDQSFVEGLCGPTHGEDAAIVTTIVRLSETLGMRAIAEGVETEEQARTLRRLGCRLAQGYWLGRPQPPEAFDGPLAAGDPRLTGE